MTFQPSQRQAPALALTSRPAMVSKTASSPPGRVGIVNAMGSAQSPCWGLRLKPGYDVERADMKTSANSILDGLTTAVELSVLLCSALFRAAGQEWFECGDIWHRMARLRAGQGRSNWV